MAIATFEVYESTVRPATDGFHVNRVIQLDCSEIAGRDSGDGAKGRELRMTILETLDLCDILRIGMAAF